MFSESWQNLDIKAEKLIENSIGTKKDLQTYFYYEAEIVIDNCLMFSSYHGAGKVFHLK